MKPDAEKYTGASSLYHCGWVGDVNDWASLDMNQIRHHLAKAENDNEGTKGV